MTGMAGFEVSLMMIVAIISPCVYGKEFPDHREMEVQNLLKRINKPALKSIKSEDGDIIDCVPIASPPALDHPLLKKPHSSGQVWHKNGECPENIVAIRRTKKEEILRSKSIERFRKKTHQSSPGDHEVHLLCIVLGVNYSLL
ncbi:hypothetical protein ARALYDRAFT_901274 [Arabidopsis lyrata subsp. lyrata]|uniref:Neprosin activation peptide domain-containing protein n=1 Tax=Arabidopsis lyrata subsp. lyrata TaxID=81972 RepID=D7LC15_ARALL|nr:hypothetical protein ARALYDRAFT_901274 [Arabidopsis lyrata subsp. lyrata]